MVEEEAENYRQNQKKENYQIFGLSNHSAEKCYNIYDERYMRSRPTQLQNNSLSAYIASPNSVDDAAWFAGTGASHNLSGSMDNLQTTKDYGDKNALTIGDEKSNIPIRFGGEYRRHKNPVAQCGIDLRYSCLYTLIQSGKAETKHRHITEMGLTLLAQAKMPLHYLWKPFQTSNLIINRLSTPFEILYRRNVDYKSLKTLDVLVIPTLDPTKRSSLAFI
ncbi:Integrase catalytic domain-containing protein [Abeliophyllum distichum]|uniref:Integrase catalytic domain-containing protein n=1 Tax=Abeliophyllum distichum TaxID=126358 RepID=A0ABD1UNI2_9LAMI